ncbi:MAG: Dabb family protein [Bacteroidales bacterium]|nr:Dabb family protein [Bacteroidales bacterium]
MLKHIVMFKMKADEGEQARKQNVEELKRRLDALPGKIEDIRGYEVGINENDNRASYDAVLISVFEGEDELNRYRKHPEHIKVLDFIKQTVESTAAVDYTDE